MISNSQLKAIQARLSLLTLAPSNTHYSKLKVATSHLVTAIRILQLAHSSLPVWGCSDEKAIIVTAMKLLRGATMGVFRKSKKASSKDYIAIIDKNASLIIKALKAGMKQNYIISLGRTRDGKSILLSVYDGEQSEKVYAATPEELAELLSEIVGDDEDEDVGNETGEGDESDDTASRRNKTNRSGNR